jgi:putative ABC transport system permease protein
MSDLRYAFRSLAKSPGFTTVAVVTLALGIGANTAIFSVVNGVLLAPPPFRDMDRLAMIWQTDRASGTTREPASIPDYVDFQRMSKTFQGMAAFTGADVNVTPASGDPFRIAALAATHQFLPLVGIQPLAGRAFTADEDKPGATRVAIISERLWEREFQRDPNLARQALRLNEVPHAIVGVVPDDADFGVLQILSAAAYGRSFADRGRVDVDIWLPLRADPRTASRDNHPIFVMGRLAPGVGAGAAHDEMTRIGADLERTYPDSNEARGAVVEPLADVVLGPIRPALYVLLAAVGLVLLVACVNVVNLLLARSAARARDVAVRTALGAGVWRLVRQYLAEGAVLSLAAAAVGLLFARWVLDLLVALAPASIPRVANVTIDLPVLGATLAIALLIATAVAIVPALQARRVQVHSMLKAETGRTASAGRVRRRVQSALVIVQVSLAIVLSIGAGLLIKSFWHVRHVDPGFRAEGVLKLEYQLPESRYLQRRVEFPNWPTVRRFHDELLERVRALPQVNAVGVTGDHPLAAGFTNSFVVVGREAEARDWPEISVRRVSGDYPRVVGLALLSGRHLRDSDTTQTTPVVAINETARRMFFAKQDPIGQQIAFWGTRRTVVGVVANEKIHGFEKATPPAAYVPFNQAPFGGTLLVRVDGDPAAAAASIRAVFRDLDPALAVFGVEPLRQTVAESMAERRFTMLLLGSFAALTLLLSALGIYGVLSYGVTQRTSEIGVRMALGAQPGSVLRLIIGQGVTLVAAGLAVGIVGALLLTRLLATLLFGITPTDPLTFAAAPLVLILTAIVASYLPARRAARVDPVVALRTE